MMSGQAIGLFVPKAMVSAAGYYPFCDINLFFLSLGHFCPGVTLARSRSLEMPTVSQYNCLKCLLIEFAFQTNTVVYVADLLVHLCGLRVKVWASLKGKGESQSVLPSQGLSDWEGGRAANQMRTGSTKKPLRFMAAMNRQPVLNLGL